MDRSFVAFFFSIDIKKVVKFSTMLDLSMMIFPFISSDDGEKVSFLFFEYIISWMPSEGAFLFFLFSSKYFLQWVCLLAFNRPTILFRYFLEVSYFLVFLCLCLSLAASPYKLTLQFMDVFISFVTHGFSSSFLSFLISCFLGACLIRVLLNR